MTTPHPFAQLVATARERLARGEIPRDIARDWASTVDDADDLVISSLPDTAEFVAEALDGPVCYVAALIFISILRTRDRKAAGFHHRPRRSRRKDQP